MDHPPATEASAARRLWADSVVLDLVVAILLAWSGGWLGDKLGPDTSIVGGGLLGVGLAFAAAGYRVPSGRLLARVLGLYLCLAAVYVGLEVIRCLIIASGRNPDCGCATDPTRAWDGFQDVGLGLVLLAIPAALGGGLAWLVRRWRPAKG